MQKRIDEPNCVTEIGSFQSDYAAHGRTSVRCRPSQADILQLYQLESEFVDLQACNVNVGTLRGRSRDIADMLERMSVDISCVQETRFRGKSG